MKKSKSLIAVALQIAACVGLLPKDAKANPIVTENGDNASIGARVAKVRQMLSRAATEQLGGTREVDGERVNWWNWHKGGWGKGGGGACWEWWLGQRRVCHQTWMGQWRMGQDGMAQVG